MKNSLLLFSGRHSFAINNHVTCFVGIHGLHMECVRYTLIPLCTLMDGFIFSYAVLQVFFCSYYNIMKGLKYTSSATDV